MISYLIRKYKKHCFVKQYGYDIIDHYTDYRFVEQLLTFSNNCTKERVQRALEKYRDTVIPTYHLSLEGWLREAQRVLNIIRQRRGGTYPTMPILHVKVKDFLTTRNNERVKPVSAFTTVNEMIGMLYLEIHKAGDALEYHYFRQYKEVLLTGLYFCRYLLEWCY